MPDFTTESPPDRAHGYRRSRYMFLAILFSILLAIPAVWVLLGVLTSRNEIRLVEEIRESFGSVEYELTTNLTERNSWQNSIVYGLTRKKNLGEVTGLYWDLGIDEKKMPLVRKALNSFPRLRDLRFGHSSIDDSHLAQISRLSELEILVLAETRISDKGVRQLAELPKLRTINLDLTDVSDESLQALEQFPALTMISVVGTRITEDAVLRFRENSSARVIWAPRYSEDVIGALNELKRLGWNWRQIPNHELARLDLRVTPSLRDPPGGSQFERELFSRLPPFESIIHRESPPPILEFLIRLENLHSLSVPELDDKVLETVSLGEQLQSLSVQVTASEEGLSRLQSLRNLEQLEICSDNITRHGVEVIATLPQLRVLSVLSNSLTDDDLEPLAAASGLVELRLRNLRITSSSVRHLLSLKQLEVLGLINAPIDNTGLKMLAEFPRLRILDISGTVVSNSALKELAAIPTLTYVNCQGCQLLTQDGVARLRAMRPDVTVNSNFK